MSKQLKTSNNNDGARGKISSCEIKTEFACIIFSKISNTISKSFIFRLFSNLLVLKMLFKHHKILDLISLLEGYSETESSKRESKDAESSKGRCSG